MAAPTQEQVTAQLRIIIPAVGMIVTAFGVSQTEAGSYVQMALGAVGPISLIIVSAWSIIANSRQALIQKVAKAGTKVILPADEAHIAEKLSDNVTAAPK